MIGLGFSTQDNKLIERDNTMYEKKQVVFKSPDLGQMQAVVIDFKTTIFVPMGTDPVKAKKRYVDQINSKYVKK